MSLHYAKKNIPYLGEAIPNKIFKSHKNAKTNPPKILSSQLPENETKL
jgi:hypothetical protein